MTKDSLNQVRLIKCDNPKCKKGEGGYPMRFSPSRSWMRFCCSACRIEAWRDKYRAGGEELVRRIDLLEMRVKKLERDGRRPL